MKPGYKTTEFWLSLFATVAPMFATGLPPRESALLGALTAGVYTASRAYAKAREPRRDAAVRRADRG